MGHVHPRELAVHVPAPRRRRARTRPRPRPLRCAHRQAPLARARSETPARAPERDRRRPAAYGGARSRRRRLVAASSTVRRGARARAARDAHCELTGGVRAVLAEGEHGKRPRRQRRRRRIRARGETARSPSRCSTRAPGRRTRPSGPRTTCGSARAARRGTRGTRPASRSTARRRRARLKDSAEMNKRRFFAGLPATETTARARRRRRRRRRLLPPARKPPRRRRGGRAPYARYEASMETGCDGTLAPVATNPTNQP